MKLARPILVLFFALVLVNCAPAFAQGPAGSGAGLEAQRGPLAEVPERLHDFGDVKEGNEYTYDFVVKNIGTAPLQITKVIKI